MYKARKPREADRAYVKDYLKDTKDLTNRIQILSSAQSDHKLG